MLAEQGQNCIRCARLNLAKMLFGGAFIGSGFIKTGAFRRLAFGALLLISLNVAGAEPPLRFVGPDCIAKTRATRNRCWKNSWPDAITTP